MGLDQAVQRSAPTDRAAVESVTSVQPEAAGLQRRLGPIDAAAIVVSNVIGGGIFFVPVIVAQLVPNPSALLAAWAAGGALAFAGAMAYAELGAMRLPTTESKPL